MSATRACLAAFCAAASALAWGGLAAAQDLPDSPEESRAALEQACREDGRDQGTCSCLGEFVVANFTERELAGAAFVLSEPLLMTDPAAAIAALQSEGYTLMEITGVVERVIALEDAATSTCSIDDAPDAGARAQ